MPVKLARPKRKSFVSDQFWTRLVCLLTVLAKSNFVSKHVACFLKNIWVGPISRHPDPNAKSFLLDQFWTLLRLFYIVLAKATFVSQSPIVYPTHQPRFALGC